MNPADQRSPLDDHAAAFRGALDSAVHGADRRRARLRTASVAVPVLAVGIAAAVLPGALRLDRVAEARAAIGSGDGIIHYRYRMTMESRGGGRWSSAGLGMEQETWVASDGPLLGRTIDLRDSASLPQEPTGLELLADGSAICDVTEKSVTPDAEVVYSPSERKAVKRSDPAGELPGAAYALFSPTAMQAPEITRREGPVPVEARDPLATVRAAIDDGTLEYAGEGPEIDGRETRVFTGAVKESVDIGEQQTATSTTKIRYVVSATNWRPLTVAFEFATPQYGGAPNTGAAELRATIAFDRYEVLPATAQNRQLLTVEIPPGTEVIRENGSAVPEGLADEGSPEADAFLQATKRAIRRCTGK